MSQPEDVPRPRPRKRRTVQAAARFFASSTMRSAVRAVEGALPAWVKPVSLMAAGAGTYHAADKANKDRALGRQIRLEQGRG